MDIVWKIDLKKKYVVTYTPSGGEEIFYRHLTWYQAVALFAAFNGQSELSTLMSWTRPASQLKVDLKYESYTGFVQDKGFSTFNLE